MNPGSLFSGIGGFDLAAEWMGWENIFHCEWNEFCQRVLKYYWSKSVSYGDVTKTDFTIHRGNIDILTGGFPCQPYSIAGKRKGKEDERHLWPEMLRAIREIQPRWIVGENVGGLVSWNGGMVFHEVQTDLENEGYEVFAFILPACAKNAPHRRDRVWIIAHSNSSGNDSTGRTENGIWKQPDCFQTGDRRAIQVNGLSNEQLTADTKCTPELPTRQETNERGEYLPYIGEEIWDNISTGNLKTNWSNFPTQSPVCIGNDGLPGTLDGIAFRDFRNESIKAGGNAIVPQVVFEIFKAIEKMENLK